jgi:leucyl aminopeptidase
MQISPQISSVVTTKQDLVVFGVYADAWHAGPVAQMDKALGGAVVRAARAQGFEGRAKQLVRCPRTDGKSERSVVVVGLGKQSGCTPQTWVRLGGIAARQAAALQAKSVCIVPPADAGRESDVASGLARGVVLGGYRFDHYKSAPAPKSPLAKVVLHLPANAAVKQAIAVAYGVATGVALARDLVNTPPNVLYPESFAKRAAMLARRFGLKVRILTPAELQRRGMNLLLAVGQGSARPPRLVHVSYAGPKVPRNQRPIALVGKGITFDSGGLCIKTCEGMNTMKMDMGGAASVLATLVTAARLKLPVAVHGILALAENMPSANAFRNGDVLRSAAGPTVEINNTDAEGRLVLADALHYALTEVKPQCVVDLATLTGACMVALGPHTVGLFSNTDALAQQLQTAAQASGEDFWRLPLTPALRSQLHSDVADLRNTGERYGGAITAALFLKEFVGDTPWAHLDIAGPAWTNEDAGAVSKGGTGVAVATLIAFLAATGGRARARN